jgi:hypothetical protein
MTLIEHRNQVLQDEVYCIRPHFSLLDNVHRFRTDSCCRRSGWGLGGWKAVSSCLRHPILCGAAAAIGAGVVHHLKREAELALARQTASEGQPLSPPGFCPEEAHSWLSATVDKLCKDDNLARCLETDTKPRLAAKALAFSLCAKARAKREDLCFAEAIRAIECRFSRCGRRTIAARRLWDCNDRRA